MKEYVKIIGARRNPEWDPKNPESRKHIEVFEGAGTFEGYGVDYVLEENNAPAMFSTVIVRMEDGTLRTPTLDAVRFITEEEKNALLASRK